MHRRPVAAVGSLLLGLVPIAVASSAASPAGGVEAAQETTYVVVYAPGADLDEARSAVAAAGGVLQSETAPIGVATATFTGTPAAVAQAVRAQEALVGVAPDEPIGAAWPGDKPDPAEVDPAAMQDAPASSTRRPPAPPGFEPLEDLQWDMRMIRATPSGAHATQRGDRRVVVAVLDTGVDGSHPDIAPNFDAARSRNFVIDIPAVDGPCEDEPDRECTDPADVDEQGHGTHVASSIASPRNGLGITGVAPEVTIVNARAGQDSGYFFLQPTVDALVHAADIGADVANMSFYVDPWLFNCAANPADSPEEQLEQQTVITAVQRALDYAHERGVTLISAAGNGNTDLGDPRVDNSSPNFPPGGARPRQVDNSCLNMPTEGEHVIVVTSVGPSTRKAYYSDYGIEQADVSAPGGDFYDFPGTELTQRPENLILGAYPASVAAARGQLDPDGTPNTPSVVRDCQGDVCAYYQWIQGTSMASPHAAGVAALIVSEYGRPDRHDPGGLTLDPRVVERVLLRTATDRPCPSPPLLDYPDPIPDRYNARCEGRFGRNGFYGEGLVDAARAVNHYFGPRRSDVR